MKKRIFYFALFASLSMTELAAKPTTAQLATQKSSAMATHLTTRLEWQRFPQIHYSLADLGGHDRAAILRINANDLGQVTQVKVQESTGIENLDRRLVEAVEQAKIKPFQQDGNATATIGYQVFNLNANNANATSKNCQYQFDSKNWQAQQQGESTAFRYHQQPELMIEREALKGKDRFIRVAFKVNKQGQVVKTKIKKGSGIYSLDAQVMQAIANSQVDVPRKFWVFRKSNLKDEIWFKFDHCSTQTP